MEYCSFLSHHIIKKSSQTLCFYFIELINSLKQKYFKQIILSQYQIKFYFSFIIK